MGNQADAFRKNTSGYSDPTAYLAIRRIERNEARVRKLISTIKSICELAGFEIEGRIMLREKESGRIWR